jgi:hypothetical protein
MAGEADSDDDWGDWTATGLRGASAGAAAPAEASEAAATTTSTTATTTTTTTTTTTAATAATAEQEEHERRFRHFTELRAAALGLVTAGSALNDFIREAVEARRQERARHAAKQRERDLERARELLATEKRLATAKERHAAAEDAVAGAERAVRAVANPSNARWEWLEHQMHLHSTRQAGPKLATSFGMLGERLRFRPALAGRRRAWLGDWQRCGPWLGRHCRGSSAAAPGQRPACSAGVRPKPTTRGGSGCDGRRGKSCGRSERHGEETGLASWQQTKLPTSSGVSGEQRPTEKLRGTQSV